jgi:hypothetical protein
MPNKIDAYREVLRELEDWEPYLEKESGLPGPRPNLELAKAVALEGVPEFFEHLRKYGPDQAPANTPKEFLAFCGTLGLAKLLVLGHPGTLEVAREQAADPRWRIREAAVLALQRWGRHYPDTLVAAMNDWAEGSALEKRAAVATLCEPELLENETVARRTLELLDKVMNSIQRIGDRSGLGFRTLRETLSESWSVAVVAAPDRGKELMEKWVESSDSDIRWIIRQSLGHTKLLRLDADWVKAQREKLDMAV